MQGLLFWANSFCRSTMAFYDGLGRAFGEPIEVVVFNRDSSHREKLGFSKEEFSRMNISYLCEIADLEGFIKAHKGYSHLFGRYQQGELCAEIMRKVHAQGDRFAVMSEAPCNMERGFRRILKKFYIRFVLPHRVQEVVRDADFIINLSGDADGLFKLGWAPRKVIPCGYYPPRLLGSRAEKRTVVHWEDFVILLTGQHTWHRDPLMLLKALVELEKKGMKYRCMITQSGPLTAKMQRFAEKNQLRGVSFTGFLPMADVVRLYETCSVFVGTGRDEPWGMRLNDALGCAAPLLVSEGMGGYRLAKEYGCGFTFPRRDYHELARCLERMITDRALYLSVAEHAFSASQKIDPYIKSNEVAHSIKERFPIWGNDEQ
ncbi:MAG: glycosyltransferase [Alloprevotella sp.]|nr:glycosyltransferase [Alloprevotella sp.]